MKMHNKRGFSMIELLASVLIVAVLVAIALPYYERAVTRSRTAEVNNLLTMVRTRQVKKFAKDKEYATVFTDPALKKIALGPNDYESNNGNKKFVNDSYELELRDTVDENNVPHRCVIGRYKPHGGQAQFAFAIAYDKSGLACDDISSGGGTYSKRVCDMFGTVVGDVDSLCAGEAAGMEDLCPNITCNDCEYLDPDTCQCVDAEPVVYKPNHIFDKTDPNCQSCRYYECGGLGENPASGVTCSKTQPFIRVKKVENLLTHSYNAVPDLGDQLFTCNDSDATLGDNTMDDVDGAHGYYAHCHSGYYKEWDAAACNWYCQPDSQPEGFCKPGEVWSRERCKCVCQTGCNCHDTQYMSSGEQCLCLDENPQEVINNGPLNGCICKGTDPFAWEGPQDRVFTTDYKHCICNENRSPVFFGTVTDKDGNPQVVSNVLDNQEGLASENLPWKAACCLNGSASNSDVPSHLWKASDLEGFAYDACCPYAEYQTTNGTTISIASKHINFNVSTKECCGASELFYNGASSSAQVYDPNSQYSNRVAGTYQNHICHSCENWQQAYDSNAGCYYCPGKTFTTWNASTRVSECSCPTGTTGSITVEGSGAVSEDCQCTKANTHWNTSISFVNYTGNQGVGPQYSNVWHAHNGACQCNTPNYVDAYWGLQLTPPFIQNPTLDTSGISTVSNEDGYCCPSPLATGVYNDNNQVVSGQKACCPRNKRFFHNTDYASNTCGVCQNQTYTYVNGTCQPCPGNMVPVYNTSLGYAECTCPTGMHEDTRIASGYSNKTLTDTCVCDMANATWQAPSGWLSNYINYAITHTASTMPGNWDSVNGYCKCNEGYELARYGFLNTHTGTIPGDEVPSTGYCCPEGQCHTAVGNSYAQDTRYCCDGDVEFNSEPNSANCCTAPAATHYYSLSDLASAGLTVAGRAEGAANDSVATIGGCARCDDPTKDADCHPCAETAKNKVPRVPVWNNDTSDGYSLCKCPAGTTETEPSWWQSFLTFIHVTTWDPDCYCTAENSTWQNGECKCHQNFTYGTASDGESYCCPNATPIYAVSPNKTHKCCQESKPYLHDDNQCHDCPADRPYRYHISGGSNDKDKTLFGDSKDKTLFGDSKDKTLFGDKDKDKETSSPDISDCHACPQNMQYQYGDLCCPNEVSGSAAYFNNAHGVCSPCNGNDVLINGVCHSYGGGGGSANPCGDEQGLVVQWDSNLNANVCHCNNGVTYSYEPVPDENGNLVHCPQGSCETVGDITTECGCNVCHADNEYDSEDLTYNLYWLTGMGSARCACPSPRQPNQNCCGNDHAGIKCCVCPNGYQETLNDASASLAQNGCCENKNLASNSQAYCCGRVDPDDADSLHIAANLKNGTCCPNHAPYYYAVKEECARCQDPEHQYWNGYTCLECPSGRILGNWSSSYHAYTTCECPVGTAINGQGGSVPNTGIISGLTEGTHSNKSNVCKCLVEGTTWNESEQKCVCGSNYGSIYASDGQTIQECCPNTQLLNDTTCCPAGTHPSVAPDEVASACCPTDTILRLYGNNYICSRCSQTLYWNGNGCAGCPNGLVPDPASWNNDLLAYTRCICPAGFVQTTSIHEDYIQGLGGNVSIGNNSSVTVHCKCPDGTHYTDNNYHLVSSWSANNGASCKSCPVPSEWSIYDAQCTCRRGFTFNPTATSVCGCPSGHKTFNVGLSGCVITGTYGAYSDSGCYCMDSCPANTCARSSNQNSGCKCEHKFVTPSAWSDHPYTERMSTVVVVEHTINSQLGQAHNIIPSAAVRDPINNSTNFLNYGYCAIYCTTDGGFQYVSDQNMASCLLTCGTHHGGGGKPPADDGRDDGRTNGYELGGDSGGQCSTAGLSEICPSND